MRKRQVKKIVKKYGDGWWKIGRETSESAMYYLKLPFKWNIPKILKYFHMSHYKNGMYWYKVIL